LGLLPPVFLLALASMTGCWGDRDPCASLDIDACRADDECQTINATPIVYDDEVGACMDGGARGPVGCMNGTDAHECGSHIRGAAPPEDPSECYYFTNWCIPSGWVACGWDSGIPACPR
jgi:hypothetical protein